MIKRNETIDYVKGLAIISVISAHCNTILDSDNRVELLFSLLLQNIGTLGVICFFVISGMLFHYPGKNMRLFFKKKISNIIIPWIISATCIYLYVCLRKPPITLKGYLNFVFGNGSYCYYLTVLMVLYVLFTFLPFMRKKLALIVCEGITVICAAYFYNMGGVNPYLNIFNWIGYFALGVQISENQEIWTRLKQRIVPKFSFWTILSSGLYTFVLIYQLYNQKAGSYWNGINVIFCWIGAITFVLIAIMIEKSKDNILRRMIFRAGVDSFGIYIWHMPVAGIVARFMCCKPLNGLVLIRPIIVLLIMLTVFIVTKKIIFKMKLDKYLSFLGLRM